MTAAQQVSTSPEHASAEAADAAQADGAERIVRNLHEHETPYIPAPLGDMYIVPHRAHALLTLSIVALCTLVHGFSLACSLVLGAWCSLPCTLLALQPHSYVDIHGAALTRARLWLLVVHILTRIQSASPIRHDFVVHTAELSGAWLLAHPCGPCVWEPVISCGISRSRSRSRSLWQWACPWPNELRRSGESEACPRLPHRRLP